MIMRTTFVLSVLFLHGGLGDLVVQLTNGKVNGTTINTPSGKTFYAWRGIPYAQPPVGKLRYLPPRRAEPWTEVRDASKDSPACIFFGHFPGDPVPLNGESEDCLYINVYSPIAAGSNSSIEPKLPVMFWIYGGGFIAGTADFGFYDPTPFLEEDVIVVSLNYRLGYFGFLSTEDDVIPGNAGLKDQWLALIWTKENIAFFGGNPLDITIFGESAGAMSVGYHIVSPMSRNLFKGAIMKSGSALVSAVQADAKELTYNLASQIDSSITKANTTAQVRDVLQAADVSLLANLTNNKMIGPVIEVKSNFSFLSEPLYEAIEAGEIARIPIIIGHNSEESIGSLNDIKTAVSQAKELDMNPEMLMPGMHLNENATAKAIGKEIHKTYVGENGSFAENLATYFEWRSDNMFLRSSYKNAQLHSKFSPVYIYQFSYYGSMSQGHLVIPGAGKVAHAEELGYLFNISTKPISTEKDNLTRKRFVKLWTNFAKTSNPTPDDDSAKLLQYVKWEPITSNKLQYLDIGDDLTMMPSRKVNLSIFWDYIWSTYSYRPYNTY